MNSDATRQITFKDITLAWEIVGSDWLKARYERLDLSYVELTAQERDEAVLKVLDTLCLLYTSPSPRDRTRSRMPSSA